jgi:hypothetical protein
MSTNRTYPPPLGGSLSTKSFQASEAKIEELFLGNDNIVDKLNSLVTGPTSATSDSIAVFSGDTGKVIKETTVTIDTDAAAEGFQTVESGIVDATSVVRTANISGVNKSIVLDTTNLSLKTRLLSVQGIQTTMVRGKGAYLGKVTMGAGSTDTSGSIITSGATGTGPPDIIEVTYNDKYPTSNQAVFLTAKNQAASLAIQNGYFINTGTDTFTINFVGASGLDPEFDYFVIDRTNDTTAGFANDTVIPTTFRTWGDTITPTNVGIVYPETDADIMTTMVNAKAAGKKVRVMGATHSAPGLVTDGKDGSGASTASNQIVISLYKYEPPVESGFRLGPEKIDSSDPKVTIPCGYTYLDLYQHIRPQKYFLPNQTAGFFFTIGGTVSNPIHGGVFGADMINRYVSRMRVIEFKNGVPVVRVIDHEEDSLIKGTGLRSWRCSCGLLGIIVAVEFNQLVERDNFHITAINETITWTEANFNQLLVDSQNDHIYAEYFIDARVSTAPTPTDPGTAKIYQVVFDMKQPGEWVPLPWRSYPSLERSWYKEYQRKWKDMAVNGDKTIPAVTDFLKAETALTPEIANGKLTAGMLIDVSALGYSIYTDECALQVNDGYWVKAAPSATIMAYFCPYEYGFEFMNKFREVFIDRWLEVADPLKYRINQMAEFRIVTIQPNGPAIFNLPPGKYVVSEVLTLNGYTQTKINEGFAEMENQWQNIPYNPSKPLAAGKINGANVRVFPHFAKNWAYSVDPISGDYEPFDKNKFNLHTIGTVSTAAFAKFKTERALADPTGVFLTPQASWLIGEGL